MAVMHVVALFLPNTLKFESAPRNAPSPPSSAAEAEKKPATASERSSTPLEVPRNASSASLSSVSRPPLTPSVANQEFLAPNDDERTTRQFATTGDPRSLVQSDAEVPIWGADQPFNQPRSSATPMLSTSIFDFPKAREEIATQRRIAAQNLENPTAPRLASDGRTYSDKNWSVGPPIHGNGALTNAIRAYASSSDIEVSWIGTLGFPTDTLPQQMRQEISGHLIHHYNSEVVYISDKDVTGHYNGYCKTILWPIFHYQVPDHPKSKAYADHSWVFYENVNEAIADKIVESYKKGDTIWVHDYHLLLIPDMVRRRLPDAQIGFFLHTAFPSSEVFRILPNRKELLRGILGANLVAFQTQEYLDHFLQTCSRVLTLETAKDSVKIEDRVVNVVAQPIGIDPAPLKEAREKEKVQMWMDILQDRFGDKKLIVNRSKLDNVHGIRQTLLAYEMLLNTYPQWLDKVVLIQVATSTTEQQELLTQVHDICRRIDHCYSSLTYHPLIFLKQDIDFSAYLALLIEGDVLVSCSLRDGMNLMGAEFTHCQDGTMGQKKHGPLIISEFTGSASILHGHLKVNPYHTRQVAAAMNQALSMNDAEKEQRWTRLHQAISRHTGSHWAAQLSSTLAKVYEEQNSRTHLAVPRLSIKEVEAAYSKTERRFFLVDLEGTLTQDKNDTKGVLTAANYAQRLSHIVNKLSGDRKNTVYIMSGCSTKELDECFFWAIRVGLVAENGCLVRHIPKEPQPPKWEALVNLDQVKEWKKAVRSYMEHFQHSMEGAEIHERECGFTFNYEKVKDQSSVQRQAGALAEQINGSCKTMDVHAVPVGKTLVVEHNQTNKGFAAAKTFDRLYPPNKEDDKASLHPDFVMVAGDDREDEAAFRWANELSKHSVVANVFTVSLGRRNTEAKAALTQGPTGLHAIIDSFARLSTSDVPVKDWAWFEKARKAKLQLDEEKIAVKSELPALSGETAVEEEGGQGASKGATSSGEKK